jgi:uncharacterized damage-inducible protein DinB
MADSHDDGSDRPWPPINGGDLPTLLGFLDYQRATFAWKCAGLSDDQLRVALPPSSMTLGGMLKHLAAVEDGWFTEVVAGQPVPEPWANQDPEWEWSNAENDTGEQLRELWTERCDRSRAIVKARIDDGGTDALEQTHAAWLGRVSLRWVLFHMIEEYARHNGHADLLRESIDGQTGE